MPVETLRAAFLNQYRGQGQELPTEREDIAILNGLNFWVREDPGFIGRVLEKLYGSVTKKSGEELFQDYMRLMVYCWDRTSGPERDNMGVNLRKRIDEFRVKLQQ